MWWDRQSGSRTGSQVAVQVVGLAVRSPVRKGDWQSGSQSDSGTGSQVASQVVGLAQSGRGTCSQVVVLAVRSPVR